MARGIVGLLSALLVAGGLLQAQSPSEPPRTEGKGTYLGALFSPVSEALRDHLPQLPPNQGVLVTHILPDSPAAKADLRRHDILVLYGDKKIRDCKHLATLIHDDRPGRKVKFGLIRGGRTATVEVTLGLGPVLEVARDRRAGETFSPRGTSIAKPGRGAVSVAATPLDDDQMKVTIEYYDVAKGRLRSVTCQGKNAAIDKEVMRLLPPREQNLVQVALQRIRALNSKKPTAEPRR